MKDPKKYLKQYSALEEAMMQKGKRVVNLQKI